MQKTYYSFFIVAFSVITLYHFGWNMSGLAALIFTGILLILSMIDWRHQRLPNIFTLPLLGIGLLFNTQTLFVPIEQAILGMIGGYLVLWSIAEVFYICTKKIGMGKGDFTLFAAIGAWLGWQPLSWVLAGASLTGLLVMVWMIKRHGHDKNQPMPFGPFLATFGLGGLWLF